MLWFCQSVWVNQQMMFCAVRNIFRETYNYFLFFNSNILSSQNLKKEDEIVSDGAIINWENANFNISESIKCQTLSAE